MEMLANILTRSLKVVENVDIKLAVVTIEEASLPMVHQLVETITPNLLTQRITARTPGLIVIK